MKTIIVTGANRGIGFEICRQLDQMGHSVILCTRDYEKGLKAATSLSKNVVVKQLDVTDNQSIHNLFHFVEENLGKVDVLINNAGIGELAYINRESTVLKFKDIIEKHVPLVRQMNRKIVPFFRRTGVIAPKQGAGNIPLDSVKQIMETNFYGPWQMIQTFTPLLQKSENGRIINVSSGMGVLNSLTGLLPGYSLSKTSLNGLTIMFSNELKEKGISVNAICPGWVKTDMGGANAPRELSEGADTAVWLATEKEIPTGKFFRDRKEISWI